MACSPKRVASQRSKALGVPPRWMCPRTVVRASLPVRFSISFAASSPTPERRTWPMELVLQDHLAVLGHRALGDDHDRRVRGLEARGSVGAHLVDVEALLGMRMTLAPPARPEWMAIQPA